MNIYSDNKRHKIILTASLYAVLLFLSSCTPHFKDKNHQPSVAAPATFPNENSSEDISQQAWWKSFKRPVLNTLIEDAFSENQEVLQALAALKQARAVVSGTSADLWPQIDAGGDIEKNWRGSDAQPSTRGLSAELSWEIDIFGRIGAATSADEYEALARAEDVDAARLALSAEVANAYFGAIAAHEGIALLREQLRLDRKLENLLKLRLDNGIGTKVDLLRQKARVADSRSLIPLAESERMMFENRLDVLLGQPPDGIARVPKTETLKISADMPPASIPAALLLNRPDLKALQAELMAADADIMTAIADRLPRITLDASYGYSDTLAFSGPLSMIMGSFVQPLLDWGKRKAEVERNKALYEERLAVFTQRYLEAVEEVDNALIRERKQREFLKQFTERRDLLQRTVASSEDRYTQGIDDYLPVIDALRELRQVERDLITEHLDLVNIRINLYKAIGGPIGEP